LKARKATTQPRLFAKIFKRDYVRVKPIPDAAAALAAIDHWMEDYKSATSEK